MYNKKSSDRYEGYAGNNWDKSSPFRTKNKLPRKISENNSYEGKVNNNSRRYSDFRNVFKFFYKAQKQRF